MFWLPLLLFVVSLTTFPLLGTSLKQRRSIVYLIHAIFLLWFPQHWIPITLAAAHSVVHERIPFIDCDGLNVRYSATVDVLVHTIMLAWIMSLARTDVDDGLWAALVLALLGCLYNAFVSTLVPVDHEEFVASSVFQAISSGAWVSLLWIEGERLEAGRFEQLLWSCMVGGALNWFLFRHSTWALTTLFRQSYFDLFFAVPVWIHIVLHQ